MENADDLRELVLDSLIEFYLQQIEQDENIAKLKEAILNDSQHVLEIRNTLKTNESAIIKSYIDNKQELENARLNYIFEQGLILGYKLATNPIDVLLGNKKTHPLD